MSGCVFYFLNPIELNRTQSNPIEPNRTQSNIDCSSGESADEFYEALEMAQTLESKVDLILTRLAGMDQKLSQIESTVTSFENKLGMLDYRVQELEVAHSNTCKTVDGLEAGLNALNTTINETKAARDKLKVDCEQKCKELDDKLLYAEVYSRRENLRFYGICEEGEQEDTYTTLKTFMEHHLTIKAEVFAEIEFQRLHRVGKPKEDSRLRPIIARFLRYGDREFIFSKAKFLKGTEFGISDDLPHEIVKRRKAQGKKLSEARKAGK